MRSPQWKRPQYVRLPTATGEAGEMAVGPIQPDGHIVRLRFASSQDGHGRATTVDRATRAAAATRGGRRAAAVDQIADGRVDFCHVCARGTRCGLPPLVRPHGAFAWGGAFRGRECGPDCGRQRRAAATDTPHMVVMQHAAAPCICNSYPAASATFCCRSFCPLPAPCCYSFYQLQAPAAAFHCWCTPLLLQPAYRSPRCCSTRCCSSLPLKLLPLQALLL